MKLADIRRVPIRDDDNIGDLTQLKLSIAEEGLRQPLLLWNDGTLISGGRRFLALASLPNAYYTVRFVNDLDQLGGELEKQVADDTAAQPMRLSEICRLWDVIRKLDEPAAAQRAHRRRSLASSLRRQLKDGARTAGRHPEPGGEAYFLARVVPPFGMSPATAMRLLYVHHTATGRRQASAKTAALAKQLMRQVDEDGNVNGAYRTLMGHRPVRMPEPAVARARVSAEKQLSALGSAAAHLSGITAGAKALGPISKELTWEQIGPVHAQFSAVRRDLEQMIKQMKEIARQ